MYIEAVIFDLDGVIVSTDEYHYLAWKKIADTEQIPFNRSVNDRLRGVSRRESLDIILENSTKPYREDEKAQLAEQKNNVYRELLRQVNPDDILIGVKQVLQSLKDARIKVAIGSSSKNARLILKQIGLLDEFDVIADGNDITRSKPDPEVFLVAARRMRVEPSSCVVVEDAVAGIDAARAAGMLSVGVGTACKAACMNMWINDLNEFDIKNIMRVEEDLK